MAGWAASRRHRIWGALAVTLTASALLLIRVLSERALTQVLLAGEPTRRLEARVTYLGVDRYRPRRAPAREPPRASLKTLARLEAQEGTQALAAAQLIRGHPAQARAVLSRSAATPDRDSDLAVTALQEGHLAEALELLDHALAANARHPQALWNRGLVLRELQLPLLAAEAFDQVAQLGEPGWSVEAREQATRLRQPSLEQGEAWTMASKALMELVQGTRKTVPLSLAVRFPDITRFTFYKAARMCTRREQVLELLPIAQVLDEHQGDTALQRYVHWVADRDFSRRAPLARGYALLTNDQHPNPQAFLEEARQGGEADIYLGALLHLEAVSTHLEEFLRIVQAAGDPWLDLMAQQELALHESLSGHADRAEHRLLTALARCDEQRFAYRCLDLANSLTDFYISVYRLAEAQGHAAESLTLARKVEEWGFERVFLQQLSEITRFRSENGLARVYLLESLARDPEQCAFVHQSLADLALAAFEIKEARKHMALALQCHQPLSSLGTTLLAQLAYVGLTPDEVERFHQTLTELRHEPQSQGKRAYLLFLEGKLELEQDRLKGQRLLRQVIREAERLPALDMQARRARSHAYSALIIDAGRAGETAQVLAWVAEARGMSEPGPCSVIVEDDDTRLLTLVRSATGAVLSHFDGARNHPLGNGEDALTASQLGALRGCQSIHVLASPSALGRARLLPSELAWGYQLGAGQPALRQPGPLLVVQNVDSPPMLRLPHLPSRNVPEDEPGQPPTLVLSGSQASPSRVLAELPRAAEIEIHAHGIFRPELFDAPFIALSPDDGGGYALDMSAIQALRLDKAPVVILAACGTVRSDGPVMHEPFGLPAAFIAAGASVVLAADVDIPDSAGTFFDAVRRRIRSGTPSAVALRDERAQWSSGASQETWVEHIFVFE
jgi:tetratricopeptide (TPR) repeat protein